MSKRNMPMRYHTFVPRFWAGVIDMIVFIPVGFMDWWLYEVSAGTFAITVWFTIHTFSYIAYSVLLHGFYGQTVGKWAMDIRVLDIGEGPASMRQAMLRDSVWFGLILAGFFIELPEVFRGKGPLENNGLTGLGEYIIFFSSLAWTFLELFSMLLNDKRRALHDLIAGTVVVRDKSSLIRKRPR